MALEWLGERQALVGQGSQELGQVWPVPQLWVRVQQPKSNRFIILNLEVTFAGSGAASFLAGVGAAEALASGSISTKGAPTGTVSPSSQWYLVMTPEYAARISTVTLSVSILAMISSALTAEPTALEEGEKEIGLTDFEGLDNTFRDGVSHGWDFLEF